MNALWRVIRAILCTIGALVAGLCLISSCAMMMGQRPAPSVGIGEDGWIGGSGAGPYYVAVDQESHAAFLQAMLAKDRVGQVQFLVSGKLFPVPEGTSVLVIGTTFTMRQVRIMSGKHFGHSGWIERESVQPGAPTVSVQVADPAPSRSEPKPEPEPMVTRSYPSASYTPYTPSSSDSTDDQRTTLGRVEEERLERARESQRAQDEREAEERRQKAAEAQRKADEERKKTEARAATLLRSAQSLERGGKTSGALSLYRRIANDFRNTPQAQTARDRIQALQAK